MVTHWLKIINKNSRKFVVFIPIVSSQYGATVNSFAIVLMWSQNASSTFRLFKSSVNLPFLFFFFKETLLSITHSLTHTHTVIHKLCGRRGLNSSVGTVTWLRPGWMHSNKATDFFLSKISRKVTGFAQPSIRYASGYFLGGKPAVAWRWPLPYSSKVMNEWSYTFTPLYTIMTNRDKFSCLSYTFSDFFLGDNIRRESRV
jgi:hypothetical protein